MSEQHAQNVARGHKAAINNPNVSEEAKQNSRRALAELEGSENPEDFTASVGSDKTQDYDPRRASELGAKNDDLRFGRRGASQEV
ncbi:uncharacterized protein B0H18DRAFT_1049203 [Fomitopsis serialis]|uniref:uncharacterized protein n=1 Tax=Fomitopsis serialis TaxID=139415 RepID=UPI002008705D|nr:uncharacterized protein B0H18DRAFT_1049203 [Neoantrodia serialis]KAH9913366.1 hypothetical protein B0H18DRAFT_1049203 [Neoantrodia serialis]